MRYTIILIALFVSVNLFGQSLTTENVFIITLDGFRWQELYNGADSLLIDDSGYVEDPEALVERFWQSDPVKRRSALMPFFWSTIAKEGQLYGNRWRNNKVNCSNHMWFSYPGYNEILCGFPDDERIHSNDKIQNPNTNVLEFFNKQPGLQGKVVAFGSWDVFPYIINEGRSGVPVNAGFEPAKGEHLSEQEKLLNELQTQIRSPWGSVRLDAFTYHYAMENIKKNAPKVVYIAFGETDDFAHDGKYDEYLKSANQTDQYIHSLWEYVQSHEPYKDKTTFIITTDHGRGTHPKDTWRSHGTKIDGSDQIWFAVMGPDTPATGVVDQEQQLYQNQVAKTAARFMGLEYTNKKEVGEVVKTMFEKARMNH